MSGVPNRARCRSLPVRQQRNEPFFRLRQYLEESAGVNRVALVVNLSNQIAAPSERIAFYNRAVSAAS
jgi:hypothetical protein